MKTQKIKRLSGILLVTLVAGTVMQGYREHQELKYMRETLAWEAKSEANLLNMRNELARRQAQKIAELQLKLKALAAEKTRMTDNHPATAALF